MDIFSIPSYSIKKERILSSEELKECFQLWFDEIRNFITYKCGDPELATDITQEAFVKVWEKNLTYQQERTKSLLFKIAHELWISQYRKQKSAEKYRLSLSFRDGSNETENAFFYEELKNTYEDALGRMSEKRRVVFLMSRLDNMSYPEIASCLSISVKAVEKRMNLALKDLKKLMHHGTETSR